MNRLQKRQMEKNLKNLTKKLDSMNIESVKELSLFINNYYEERKKKNDTENK